MRNTSNTTLTNLFCKVQSLVCSICTKQALNPFFAVLLSGLAVFLAKPAIADPDSLIEFSKTSEIVKCMKTRFTIDLGNNQESFKKIRLKVESRSLSESHDIPLAKKFGQWRGEAGLAFADDWKITLINPDDKPIPKPISKPAYVNNKTDLKKCLKQNSFISPALLKDDKQRQFIRARLKCPDAEVQFFKCNGTAPLKIKIPGKMVKQQIQVVVLNLEGKFAWQFYGTAKTAELEIPIGKCKFANEFQAVIVLR